MKSTAARFRRPSTYVYIAIILLVAWGIYGIWFAPKPLPYQLAKVSRGSLTETVSITGNTAPVHSVDLAFEAGGTISAVNAPVGSHVSAGQVIAQLDTSALQAQLAQAQANVDTQSAKLSSLEAGSRPEDIASAQATLAKAQQDLSNMYANIPSVLLAGYAEANDATRNQISPFFTSAESTNPQLTFSINDSQVLNNIKTQRVQATTELNSWQTGLASISATSPTSTLESALINGSAHLNVISALLTTAGQALIAETDLTPSILTTYKTDLSSALTEINTATGNVNGASQSIASQKLTIAGLEADLQKTVAGSTPDDIAAQKAQVEQAEAAVQGINVQIANTSLVAPVSGIVTTQNAIVGQIASAGATLASLISDQGLEVDAYVAEADIGKIAVGDQATMTLDAFQGKMFTGKVASIDPGETEIEGVPTYKTRFAFDLSPDVKPGMTANIDIVAATHDNVLYIPQRAVTTDASGNRTVQLYKGPNEPPQTQPITVGIRDDNGNIEVTSGLSEGDQIVRPSE